MCSMVELVTVGLRGNAQVAWMFGGFGHTQPTGEPWGRDWGYEKLQRVMGMLGTGLWPAALRTWASCSAPPLPRASPSRGLSKDLLVNIVEFGASWSHCPYDRPICFAHFVPALFLMKEQHNKCAFRPLLFVVAFFKCTPNSQLNYFWCTINYLQDLAGSACGQKYEYICIYVYVYICIHVYV